MTIIKKFDTKDIRPNKFSKKYIAVCLSGLLFLLIAEIWVSNTTLIQGERFDSMQIVQKNLYLENQILQNKIAKNSSLSKIDLESSSLGFSRHGSIQYIR